MPKHIVICSDGTGNTAAKNRGSNVFKLYEAVEFRANQQSTDNPQVAFYDDGVGTASFKPLKILGGAVGLGFSRNVRQLYAALARCYRPGDKVFVFGFSRGAFTVRSLVRLIAHVGLIDIAKLQSDQDLDRLVKKAYSAHRKCFKRFGKWRRRRPEDDKPAEIFRENHCFQEDIPIEFVGVWDTVDAVGFPLDEIADLWHNVVYPFRFPDTQLSDIVQCARHAVSIDDQRRTFHPELWNETPMNKETGRLERDQRIKQVWFAGVHSNVGGGYPKQGMSIVALVWMMQEAEARGLRFVQSVRQLYTDLQNANDKLYDSRAGLAGYYGYKPRGMAELCATRNARPLVHISAIERIAVGTDGYAPGNLSPDLAIIAEDPGIDTSPVKAVVRETFEARGNLIGKAKPWINVWRLAQVAFILATLYTVALYFSQYRWEGLSQLMSFTGYKNLANILWSRPAVLAALAITYGICYLADNRLRAAYSRFWFDARKDLRVALGQTMAAKAAAAAAANPEGGK